MLVRRVIQVVLAQRIRDALAGTPDVVEKKMFGGVCFMINGNMCVGPWKGSLIVRLDKKKHDETQSEPYVKPMDITGKRLPRITIWPCSSSR